MVVSNREFTSTDKEVLNDVCLLNQRISKCNEDRKKRENSHEKRIREAMMHRDALRRKAEEMEAMEKLAAQADQEDGPVVQEIVGRIPTNPLVDKNIEGPYPKDADKTANAPHPPPKMLTKENVL